MGAQTRNVGGGSATGVANDWNSFLRGQLNQQQSNQQQPGQQTNAFQNALNGMLGGQGNDVNGSQRALQQFWQNPGMPQAPQQSNPLLAGAGSQRPPMQQQNAVPFNGQMPVNVAPGNPMTQGGGPQAQMGGMPSFGGNGYSGLQNNSQFMQNIDMNDPRLASAEFRDFMNRRGDVVGGQGGQQPINSNRAGNPVGGGFDPLNSMPGGGNQSFNPLGSAPNGMYSNPQTPMNQGGNGAPNGMQWAANPQATMNSGGAPPQGMQWASNPQFTMNSNGGGNAPPMFPPDGGQMGGQQQLPTFANPYQNQQFVNPNVSQLPTNYGAGQTGMADLSGFGGIGPTNVNTSAGMGSTGQSDYGAQLQQLLAQSQGMLQGANSGGGANVQQYNLAPAAAIDLNNPLVAAQEQGMERQRQIAVADQRARFGADGSGSLGSGAQVAEGTLNAEFVPRSAQFLQQSIQQQQANDLANRSLGANVGLANAGNDLQGQIATMQGNLQGRGQANSFNSSLLNSQLSSALQGRGQDFNNQATNRGMDISQMGLGLNQAQGNQGAALTQQGQMLQSMLQNQGMGNAFGLNAFNANSGNQQQNNANSMNNAGMQNQFNLNNAGNMAQYGQGTNSLNLQSAMAGQNNLLQALGMGQQQNQFNSSQQADIMRMLFGAFGQSNALGTPQAQSVTTPSPWGQALNAITSIGSSWLQGGGGNPFGGGGGNSQLPQMPNFGGFQPTTGNGGWRPGQPTYQPSWGR